MQGRRPPHPRLLTRKLLFWTLPQPPPESLRLGSRKERDAHLEPVTFQMIVRRSC
jgi:hypothetical protein